jgi:hypothetical protein
VPLTWQWMSESQPALPLLSQSLVLSDVTIGGFKVSVTARYPRLGLGSALSDITTGFPRQQSLVVSDVIARVWIGARLPEVPGFHGYQFYYQLRWASHWITAELPYRASFASDVSTGFWRFKTDPIKRRICSCSKAVYKPVWHIPLLSVQWINSWWCTDELSEICRVSWQNKFVKLVHLVDFDVITSLVSLVYWGFRCEKVTSQH